MNNHLYRAPQCTGERNRKKKTLKRKQEDTHKHMGNAFWLLETLEHTSTPCIIPFPHTRTCMYTLYRIGMHATRVLGGFVMCKAITYVHIHVLIKVMGRDYNS